MAAVGKVDFFVMDKSYSGVPAGNSGDAGGATSRMDSLDVLKCLAAFFVVNIHYGSSLMSPFSRTAVPLFFIITGFYYPVIRDAGTFWRHMRKLVIMSVMSSFIYGTILFFLAWYAGNVETWVDETFNLRNIVSCVITGSDLFGFHLWYLYAVIYDLVILYIADKFRVTKYLKYTSAVLLVVFLVSNFVNLVPFYGTRNFIFMGLPCIMIGRMIRDNEDRYLSFFDNRKRMPVVILVSLVLCYAEYFYHGMPEMFIFTIPLVLSVFYWALRNPGFGFGSIPALIGRRYSAYIYIFHVIAFNVVSCFFRIIEVKIIAPVVIYPCMGFFLSLLIAMFFVEIKDCLCCKKTCGT